jgi:VWFA-related protein
MVGSRFGTTLACLLALYGSTALSQQSIPDAPQPKPQQPAQFPDDAPAAPKNSRTQGDGPAPAATPAPTPLPPQGDASDLLTTDLSQFPRIIQTVNFVQVPVTVKDRSGHLYPGLTSSEFTVLEDGQPQRLSFFYSGSFPLSAAVVVATELPTGTMKKVNETLPALMGAFSQYDEVALYRYGHTVSQASGFTGAANVSTAMLSRVKRPGREGGPPAVYGPIAAGPTINGHEADPGVRSSAAAGSPNIPPPVQESYVLNDAILRAAQDLSRRPKDRRKIIFVVSDGREYRSNASYDEVRKVLLSNGITVYAVGVDTAAMPIYDKLNRIRVIGFGYGNILGRYANDTGGDTFASFDRQSIEEAYSRITEQARNQYTLGYNAKATASSAFRSIVVNVHRPGLSVRAKDGYYPLPPKPSSSQ